MFIKDQNYISGDALNLDFWWGMHGSLSLSEPDPQASIDWDNGEPAYCNL